MTAVVTRVRASDLTSDVIVSEIHGPRQLTALPPGQSPWFTVIIPTRNEVDSVGPLLERLRPAMADACGEVLFVDDSTDETPQAIKDAAHESGLAVRLLHRSVRHRRGGLGGAVLDGLRHARGTWAVVMDGDLQHPPELAPKLAAIGRSRQLDLVAASRYIGAGNADGLNGGYRKTVSNATTIATKAIFPRRLGRLSDPMSGFFAVRIAALNPERLRPIGFKILLEIAVRHPKLRTAEVPFTFGTRFAGESKASVREGARFARQIARLRFAVFRAQVRRSSTSSRSARLARFLSFGAVGASGLVVNTAALWLLTRGSAHHYLLAAILATQVSTTWNFALTETLVFRGRKPGRLLGRAFKFYFVNNVALLMRLPLLALLVELFHVGVLVGNVLTLILLFIARFLIADSAIYAPKGDDVETEPMRIVVDLASEPAANRTTVVASRPGTTYLPYRYSIDGVATIGSQVRLRELEYFRAQWLGQSLDIEIRVGAVGRGGPRRRAQMTQLTTPPGLRYEEHFGRLGANFHVDIGDRIRVIASPTFAKSPHVLYTNVIEALLRFVAVSRGHILLHSACMEINGRGVLLSARTDTGKTGTVLRLLREKGALFLSDDMTILSPNGQAGCFPKPLTISHHTLRAVEAGDLTPGEWRRLRLQSRLHSREGRQLGMMLARMNLPIMGFNSLTQRLVPPPKYAVDRLVDCIVTPTTHVEDLFIIERGPLALEDLDLTETLETLVTNTDDAYGFPPFRQMAPSIVIGNDDYDELRRKERAILASAMANIRARRLACEDFSWADRIPELLDGRHRATAFGPVYNDAVEDVAAVAAQA
jgi:dolichol-phosphate mannosyltransferase